MMNKLIVGAELDGGIIFNLTEDGQHGLIASTHDLSGTADWDEAIQYCLDYEGNGFKDWYLPSIEELDLLFKQKDKVGIFERFCYWSATEYAEHFGWFQHFLSGAQDNDFKDNTCYVRAIRKF